MDVFGLGLLYINNWLFLFAAIVVVAYYYYTWNYGYWESRGIPGPKPKFPMGTMTGHVRDMDVRNARKYGQVYGIYEGRRPVLMVQDPELLKCIFVKNHHDFPNRRNQKGDKLTNMMLPMAEGEQWKALRAAMSPTFSTGKLKLMFEQVTECAQDMADAMSKEANTGKSFDIKEYSGRYALDVISTTAYGLKIEAQQDKDNKFITMAQKIFDSFEFNIGYVISFFFPFLVPLLEALEVNFFAKDAQGFFKHVTQQTMEARRESGQKRTDFIQLMMNAHKEPNEQQEHDTEFNELYKGTTRRRLTTDEVLAQGMVFLPTAYDTTAASVSFLIYNLALNSEIQEKVHEEIDRVAGNESISNNMLSQMSLLDMCVQESLRIYIPGFRTDRVCSNETKIGDISIPKGMLVVVPIYAIHHDPKIWPEPEKFNPYRFGNITISLLMNITMNQLGGASVIAKFHS